MGDNCPILADRKFKPYRVQPAYRVGRVNKREPDIMYEVMTRGPVQVRIITLDNPK